MKMQKTFCSIKTDEKALKYSNLDISHVVLCPHEVLLNPLATFLQLKNFLTQLLQLIFEIGGAWNKN